MTIDGYLDSKCAITVNHVVASLAVFSVLFLHSAFDHVYVILAVIKGHRSFDRDLSCTFHIIKDPAGECSAQKLLRFVR